MSAEKMYDLMLGVSRGVRKIRFLPATNNYEALIDLPALLFEEYTNADPDRMYDRGEVLKMPGDKVSKYLLTGDGRIQPDKPPPENSLCKLFRNAGLDGAFEWVREEFCTRGFLRHHNGKLWRVKVDRVDDATPPPNATDRWEEVTE